MPHSWRMRAGAWSLIMSALACTPEQPAPYGRGVVTLEGEERPGARLTLRLDSTTAAVTLRPARYAQLPTRAVGAVSDAEVVGDLLLLLLPGRTHHLYAVDTGTGQPRLRGLPRVGATPAVFTSLGIDPKSRQRIWAHEFYSNRLVQLGLDPRHPEIRTTAERRLAFTGALRTPSLTGNGHVLASGLLARGAFIEFNTADTAVALRGRPPVTGDSVEEDIRVHLALGRLRVRATGDRVATGYLSTPFLDILARNGALIRRLVVRSDTASPFQVPEGSRDPEGHTRFTLRPGMRSGFLDITSTDRYIYGLYGGRIFRPAKSPADEAEDFSLGQWLVQMTWDGTVVRVRYLAQGASVIAVAADDRTLFATAGTTAPVAVYHLDPPTVAYAR